MFGMLSPGHREKGRKTTGCVAWTLPPFIFFGRSGHLCHLSSLQSFLCFHVLICRLLVSIAVPEQCAHPGSVSRESQPLELLSPSFLQPRDTAGLRLGFLFVCHNLEIHLSKCRGHLVNLLHLMNCCPSLPEI